MACSYMHMHMHMHMHRSFPRVTAVPTSCHEVIHEQFKRPAACQGAPDDPAYPHRAPTSTPTPTLPYPYRYTITLPLCYPYPYPWRQPHNILTLTPRP